MSKHTPGPWTVEIHQLSEGPAWVVYDASGHRIADYLDEATARLIAAAPDGLGAAIATYEALLSIPAGTLLRINTDPARAKLRDFIAAATGRESQDVQAEYEQKATPCQPF